MPKKRALKPVKWGRLKEIDRRTHVGTPAWFRRHPVRVQKLSAFRRLHKLGNHTQVHQQGVLRKRKSSSNMTVKQMISSIKSLQSL